MHLPILAETCRKVVEQLDPETLVELQVRLFLIARNIEKGRLEVAKSIVDEMRKVMRAGDSVK